MKKGEKVTKKKSPWIENGSNMLLKAKGFYISYNPDTNASGMGMGGFYNALGGMLVGAESDGRAETALCKNGKFYILNGDFRKQYEKLVAKGFSSCKKFYEKQDCKSGWSN